MGLTGCIPQASSSESTSNESATFSFNAEGLPITNEPYHYNVLGISVRNKNYNDLEYFNRLEESTNIMIDWTMSPTDGWSEKKSLLFAGNELPDALPPYPN